jgi:chromosome segregation ATPase
VAQVSGILTAERIERARGWLQDGDYGEEVELKDLLNLCDEVLSLRAEIATVTNTLTAARDEYANVQSALVDAQAERDRLAIQLDGLRAGAETLRDGRAHEKQLTEARAESARLTGVLRDFTEEARMLYLRLAHSTVDVEELRAKLHESTLSAFAPPQATKETT